MEYRPGIKNRVIARETDFRVLVSSLADKPFAISPPIEVDNSFMMGLANEDINKGICIHLPLSALSEAAALLFTTGGREIPVYVHSLKQIINWVQKRNIVIPIDRFRDLSIAAYLLKPPESDKGEDWQDFLLSSMVRNHLGQEYSFLPRQVEQEGYPVAFYHRLMEDACSVWELGKTLIPDLQADPLLYRLYCDVEMPLIPVLAQMERNGIGVDLPKIRRHGLASKLLG